MAVSKKIWDYIFQNGYTTENHLKWNDYLNCHWFFKKITLLPLCLSVKIITLFLSLQCQLHHKWLCVCGPEAHHPDILTQASGESAIPTNCISFAISGYILQLSSSFSHFYWKLLFILCRFYASLWYYILFILKTNIVCKKSQINNKNLGRFQLIWY